MNSNHNPSKTKDFFEEAADNTLSIDEFFRQLEAKEKDLDISSNLVIEVDELSLTDQDISDFLQLDLSVAPNKLESHKPESHKSEQPPPAAAPAAAAPVYEENTLQPVDHLVFQAEMQALKSQLVRTETERVELYEIARRRQSDFENYKNRTERERGETFRNQLSNLATQMLPVVDNLNRALDSSGRIAGESTRDLKQFLEGIVLVSQQLNEILAEMGVQPINAVGEQFDPHLHEAVATEVTDEFPSHTVTAELLRGYRIGEKVVRPSMVKVSVPTIAGTLSPLPTFSDSDVS